MKKIKLLPIILSVVVVVVVVLVYVLFSIYKPDTTDNNISSTEGATGESFTIPEDVISDVLNTTEIPEEMNNKVQLIKDEIKNNGYEEDDYKYLGCMFGTNLYCSIRYYEEMDLLSLHCSYYVQSKEGDFIEVLAVLEDFPKYSNVYYYEDYCEIDDESGMLGDSIGTFMAEAEIDSTDFTSLSEIKFTEMEDSSYEIENLDATYSTAEKYSRMAFSFWDEMLEIEFEMNLKDFGYKNFVREDYKAESVE